MTLPLRFDFDRVATALTLAPRGLLDDTWDDLIPSFPLEGLLRIPYLTQRSIDTTLQSGHFLYRRRLASHPHCPAGVLAVLINDNHPDVATSAREHPRLDPVLLAADPAAAVQHPRCSAAFVIDQLNRLANINVLADTELVRSLAASPHLDADQLNRLVTQARPSPVLEALLTNPNLTHSQAVQVLDRLHTLPQYQQPASHNIWMSHPNADVTWLRSASVRPTRRGRAALVRNPSCPGDIITRLLDEKHSGLPEVSARDALSNPNLEPGHLRTLFDVRYVVNPAAALHPSTDRGLLDEFNVGHLTTPWKLVLIDRWADDRAHARASAAVMKSWTGSFGEALHVARGILAPVR